MTVARRVLLSAALALVVLLGAVGAPAGAQDTPTAPTSADETDEADEAPSTLPEELGNIVGSPEPGPKPEDAGDRGGWAQLGLLGVLVVAVALVLRHLFRSANRNEPPAEA